MVDTSLILAYVGGSAETVNMQEVGGIKSGDEAQCGLSIYQ